MKLPTDPISIVDYITHLKSGGSYTPSREVIALLQVDPVAGSSAMNHVRDTRAPMAVRHGRALERKRLGNSKYMPAVERRKGRA